MLQAIRSKAESVVVKLLFFVLALTFGVWGIGDIFRNWGTDTSVAKVGSIDIGADQVGKEARAEMDQLRKVLPNGIDADQAKQLGILNSAIERIIGGTLLDLETRRLKLLVSNDAIRQVIANDPTFKGQQGSFDHDRYVQLLAANQLNESTYESSLRTQMIRNQLTDAVSDGMSPPAAMVDALYRSRAERRIADIVTLTSSAVPAPSTPTDEQILAYYNAHKDDFRSPEERAITVATLKLDDIASTIAVTPEKLKAEYAARQNDYQKPEQRNIEQMLLPDEASAKNAKAQLDSGKDFASVAKTLANADASSTDLGWVKKDDLPDQLADTAFSLPKGKPSDPVQTSFGWHVLMVTDIKPAATESLDSVKDALTKDIQRDAAGDAIAKTANDIDDATAGGASFEQVVQKFGLKMQKVAAIDEHGRALDGKPIDLPQPSEAVLQQAFATGQGGTSPLSELGEDGYFLVHIDKVTPAQVRPLVDARKDVVAAWQAEQRRDALDKLAASMVGDVNGGKSLKDVAAAHKLAMTSSQPLSRTSDSPAAPPSLIAALFGAKPNTAVSAVAGDNVVVAQLKTIEPADPAQDQAGVKRLTDQLSASMKSDVLNAYTQTLRATFPVEINQANLDRVL